MTDATKVPKWAMEVVTELDSEGLIDYEMVRLLFGKGPQWREDVARLIAAAAPDEAEIRRDERQKVVAEMMRLQHGGPTT